jgi:hypothetical protein
MAERVELLVGRRALRLGWYELVSGGCIDTTRPEKTRYAEFGIARSMPSRRLCRADRDWKTEVFALALAASSSAQSCDVLDWPFWGQEGPLVEGERRERQLVDRKIDVISHDATDVHSA